MSKRLVLLFIFILTAPVVVVFKPAYSSILVPSVPEFTLKFEAHPYYVPPTYTIDPYTGKNVVDKQGYHVENESIVIKIKNQDFSSYVNNTKYYMAYNVRVKGHFGDEWEELYSLTQCTMSKYLSEKFPKASDSDYTFLSVSANYPPDAKVDFQVQTKIGYESQIGVLDYIPDHPLAPPIGSHYEEGIVFDSASDWSNTKTINLSTSASTVNLDLPDQLTFIITSALILIPIAAGLGLLIHLSRKK